MKLYFPLGFLLLASLVTLSSISMNFFKLQATWMVFGILLIVAFLYIDWRAFLNYRWLVPGLYVLSIALLILAYLKGPLINETKSWLVFGPVNLQPVEVLKVSLILLFAQFFSRRHLSIARWKNILISFIYFAIPGVLIALQPDFGSGLIIFGIWFGFLLMSGLPIKRIAVAVSIFVIGGFLMWSFILKPYQKNRIVGIFYPNQNTLSTNYSLTQSKIAIGSAGFLGKGYHQGSQTQLGFLTEPETDFIFAAIIEEWGWLVGILVVASFISIILWIIKVASIADQNFEKFICLGAAISLSWQFFLNVGSILGLSPVIGVPFPFLSYGGSSLLTSFFLVAIINAIARKSY